ncbi:MAG TPA: heme-binding protein [Devosia sp.]|nr:heme-binding protein [Devosia sp.]
MDLRKALALVEAALAEARQRNAAPLSVTVLDAGGNVVACAREDGAGIARLNLAYGKAWGSLGLGFGSRTLSQRVDTSPPFFAAAASLVDGRLLPAPGGVLVFEGTKLIGAIGVSGDTGDIDEACALVAITALGLDSKV